MTLGLPPLFSAVAADGAPLDHAIRLARNGCDGGTLVYDRDGATLGAAIVFAPETPLSHAAQILPVAGVGLQNALGALAPPEVAVHLSWDGLVYVNGGRCGALSMIASDTDPDSVPDWLIVSLSLDFLPPGDDPGEMPDRTALYAEGCGDVTQDQLLAAWARHMLVWINRWSDGDLPALHKEWSGLSYRSHTKVIRESYTGLFIGYDDDLAALLKTDGETRAVPLTDLVRRPD